jgi:hypothetical protein
MVKQTAYQSFQPSLATPRDARAFVMATLFLWGRPAAVPDVQLIASELVTNAVSHAHGTVGVCLELDTDVLRISISDHAPDELPALQPPQAHDGRAGGRGLEIVDTIAQDWGYTNTRRSKTVWAELVLPVEPRSAPRRSRV